MHSKLGHKLHGAGQRLGNKFHNTLRQGAKIVKPALMVAGAAAVATGAALEASDRGRKKSLRELQQSTNINNTGIGADAFRVPGRPDIKPFTEEAFPTMIFRE